MADLDGDGAVELVVGLASADGGLLRIEALSGSYRQIATPVEPFHLAAGDLNGDGLADLVFAARDGFEVIWLPGPTPWDAPFESLRLPGPVTAIEVGNAFCEDSLDDLVVAAGGRNPELRTYRSPYGVPLDSFEEVRLPAEATALDLDGGGKRSSGCPMAVTTDERRLLARADSSEGGALVEEAPVVAEDSALTPHTATASDGPISAIGPLHVVTDLTLHLNGDALKDRVLLTRDEAEPGFILSAAVLTLTVDSTGDLPDLAPGDGNCITSVGDCTLRAAMEEANSSLGADMIVFGIPGVGVQTIQPLTPLPALTDAVVIDGTTQPGWAAATAVTPAVLVVELDGSLTPDGTDGLVITGGSSVVRGLVINRFPGVANGHGIVLSTAGGNIIEGNHIGTDADGVLDLGNGGAGVRIESGDFNTVGGLTPAARNILSGNDWGGVWIVGGMGHSVAGNYIGTQAGGSGIVENRFGLAANSPAASILIGGTAPGAGNVISGNQFNGITLSGADDVTIQGNLIGLDATGASRVRNGGNGILVANGSDNPLIGGSSSSARNIISGNLEAGIEVHTTATDTHNTRIQGNYIGTDITGAVNLGNSTGINLETGSFVRIGGANPGEGNLISGNSTGILAFSNISSSVVQRGNIIQGNFIGTDVAGTGVLGNSTGISLGLQTLETVIGGGSAGAANIISGNGTGIGIFWSEGGDQILGNFIGTDASGTLDLGNTSAGINIGPRGSSTTGITIGTTASGEGNTIAYNGVGISISGDPTFGDPTGHTIRGNSIHSNDGLGIDLAGDGIPTPNDIDDIDTGPNNLQNFPVITSVTGCEGLSTSIAGHLQSTPSTLYRIDFYLSPEADPSGYGEGRMHLGDTSLTTDVFGAGAFSLNFATSVAPGWAVTATATNATGDSSEFSAAFIIADNDSDGDGAVCSLDCDDSNADVYPGAPETNDGLDNQCPGDFGFGLIDEISGDSGFHNSSDLDEYSWDPQANASLYKVARSLTPEFSTDCVTFIVGVPFVQDPDLPLPGGVFHYLVRSEAPFVGSWGEGTGGERIEICEAPAPRRIFVTSVSAPSGNLGGLAGADAFCQNLADNAGLGGIYKAWLSDSNNDVKDRMTQSSGPYQLINGTQVASSFSDLICSGCSLDNPINVDENGNATGLVFVYTGTIPGGVVDTGFDNCNDWTATANAARSGRSDRVDSQWTACCSTTCNTPAPLYCVEQ